MNGSWMQEKRYSVDLVTNSGQRVSATNLVSVDIKHMGLNDILQLSDVNGMVAVYSTRSYSVKRMEIDNNDL